MIHIPAIEFKDPSGHTYSVNLSNNQKAIQIHRNAYINYRFNRKALETLSSDAYTLYMYLLLNQAERVWALSSQDVFNHTALKKRTYTKAVTELQEAGYLTAGPIYTGTEFYTTNTYHLWEDPELNIYKCGA